MHNSWQVTSWQKYREKRMSKTILVWLLATFSLATVSRAEAQQLAKIPRVGFLRGVENEGYVEAFRQELKKLGYVEGENIALEYRSGKTDQLPKLAAELVGLQVVIILADGSGPAGAAKQATSKIPIVMTTSTILLDSDSSPALRSQVETSRDCRPIAEIWVGKT